MHFVSASISHTGGRSINQDFAGAAQFDRAACWVVADGLGGHGGGEVASETAVMRTLEAFERRREVSTDALQAYVEYAQEGLLVGQMTHPRLAAMRTTLVVLATDYDRIQWAHIGDTRLYHLRGGRLVEQTKDHSVPQALVDAGEISLEDIRTHIDRNRILRALGKRGELRLEIAPPKHAEPGDAFLLCTDGFWEYVLEDEIEADYASNPHPEAWLATMATRVRSRATGAHDNYTALAVTIV